MKRLLLLTLLLAACSGGHRSKPSTATVAWSFNDRGVQSVKVHGQELMAIGGGLYIIGSCGGVDDPNQNVRSRTLNAPGSCPGAPFSLVVTKRSENTIHVSISVGPVPVNYTTLSVPMDLDRNVITDYAFATGPLFVNGDSTVQAAASGAYASVPQIFVIPGYGKVGYVHSRRSVPWIEARSATARIRRQFSAGSLADAFAYNHFSTHNLEASFGSVARGRTVTLEEDVTVYATGAG